MRVMLISPNSLFFSLLFFPHFFFFFFPAPTGSSLLQYLERLNRKLQGLGMKVGVARMEDSLESWYGLVNLTPDAAAKEGSKYSAQQLEFFNKIVRNLNK